MCMEKGSASEPLIGIHSLGIVFWRMKEDDQDGYIGTAHTKKAHRSYTEQVLDLVTTEHKISAKIA